MIRFIAKLLLAISILLFFSISLHAATLEYSASFDDQSFPVPSHGSIIIYKDFLYGPTYEGTDYDFTGTGRSGTGGDYCFSGKLNVAAYGFWQYSQQWPTDQMFQSWYMKFDSISFSGAHKINYTRFGSASEHQGATLQSLTSGSYINYHVLDGDNQQIYQNNFNIGVNAADGNWHHWEIYINFATKCATWWVDESQIQSGCYPPDGNAGDGSADTWSSAWVYYVTLGSANNGATNFLRRFDDWEVYSCEDGDGCSDGDPQVAGADETAPVLATATIGTNGTTITLEFTEEGSAVSQGAGYDDSDWNVNSARLGGEIAMTYVSGNGTNTHIYSLAQAVDNADTITIDYGGDTMEDAAENQLAAIDGGAVINESGVEPPAVYGTAMSGISMGGD